MRIPDWTRFRCSIVRNHWDARAATYDDDPEHGLLSQDQREAWRDVLGRLGSPPPQCVLDVGCGTGFLALMFAEFGHTVTGVDFAPQMLNLARQKARRSRLSVRFRLENNVSLSDPDGTYDLVVGRHVIWTHPDPARAVGEWARVLRSGGRLALFESTWSPNEAEAERSYTKKSASAALLRAPLSIIHHGAMRAARKRTPWALLRAAVRFVAYGAMKEQWTFLLDRLNDWRYQRVQLELPFYGGAPAERLVALFEAQGLRDITIEPLMSQRLWGEVPQYRHYLAMGRRG